MTTNKPEVVAWRWRKPVVNDQGETVGATAWELSAAPGFLPWWTNDPLIRLSDYEALQAELEQWKNGSTIRDEQNEELHQYVLELKTENDGLRTALAESRANDRQAMYYLNQVREIVGGDDFPDMVQRCRELMDNSCN